MQWKFFAMFDEKKKIKNLNLRLIFCMLLIFRYTHVSYIKGSAILVHCKNMFWPSWHLLMKINCRIHVLKILICKKKKFQQIITPLIKSYFSRLNK